MPTIRRVYTFGEFALDRVKRTLFEGNRELRLGGRDLDVLLYLIDHAGQFSSIDEIIAEVWGGTNVLNNSVEKIIANIRKALKDDRRKPRFIRTEWGKGYAFIADFEGHDNMPKTKDVGAGSSQSKSSNGMEDVSVAKLTNRHKRIMAWVGISVVLIVLGFVTWKAVGRWLRVGSTSVFADDFSGREIDANRWTAAGKTVSTQNGIAKLSVDETDNWGRLYSNYFTFDPAKPLIVRSKLKVAFSRNRKDTVYFHGYFGLTAKTSVNDQDLIKKTIFGVDYANYDHESKYPDGNTYEQKAEGFFLVKSGGMPHIRIDYETGKVSPRIEPVWDKWFEQTIIYDPASGKMEYFIDGERRMEFNVGKFSSDLKENKLRLEINPEGWWLYHTIEMDYIEVIQ